jgi:hypothetical protein
MEGERINLRPVRQQLALRKELRISVLGEEQPSDDSIANLIDLQRQRKVTLR